MSEPTGKIVIVGGGPAGQAAAGAYREAGGEGTVTILAREPDPPYERPPLTKGFLRGEAGREALPLAPPEWYAEREIELRTEVDVVRIDLERGAARSAAGQTFDFDRVLLATGARPTVPSVPNVNGGGAQTVRQIADSERLAKLGKGDRVVVIGSGFIGCEAAASLAMRGATVTVASEEPAPQALRLGEDVAARIAGWLGELGIEIVPEAHLASIRDTVSDGNRILFADGREALGGRVLLAVGIERNDRLAAAAGVPVEDGVEVGASMVSADPRLLAAGDVAFAFNTAAGRRLRVEHWDEARRMGEIAGRTMAGEVATWDVAPSFWSTIGEHTVRYAGWGDGWDEARFEPGEDGAFACWYERDGEVVGVLTHEDDGAHEKGRRLMERRAA